MKVDSSPGRLRARRRNIAGVPLALTFGVLLVITGGQLGSLPIWLAGVNIYLCLHRIFELADDPDTGPVELTFWPFVLAWVCVPTLVQLHLSQFPWPDTGQSGFYVPAELILTLALVSYQVGVGAVRHRARREPKMAVVRTTFRPWIPLLIGGILLAPVLAATGGVAGRFSTRDDVTQGLTAGGSGDTIRLYFLNRLPGAAALVAAYGAVYLVRHYRRANASVPFNRRLQVAFAVVLVVLLDNPFSSSRYAAFGAVMAITFGMVRIHDRSRRSAVLVAVTVGLLTIYPLASYFKKSSEQLVSHKLGIQTYLSLDFDGFQQTVNTLSYVQARGHTFGIHILSALGFLIPRSIWAGKATAANLDIAASRGYHFTNLSLPLWAEFYLELGLVGVVVLMALLGWLARRLDMRYAAQDGSRGAHLAVLFAVAQTGLIRGPLGGSFVSFGSILLLGVLACRRPPDWQSAQRRRRIGATSRSIGLFATRVGT